VRSSDLRLARRLAEQGYDIIEMARRVLIAAQAGPVSAAARSAISARKRRYQAERREAGRNDK
jgi:hypothetical protein